MSALSRLADLSVIPMAEILAWTVVAVFLTGWIVHRWVDRKVALAVLAGGWLLFGTFCLLLLHYFVFVHRSYVQSVLVLVAIPGCLLVAVRILDGRTPLTLLTRAVAIMGVIYLPFTTWAAAQGVLIETVTQHTAIGIELLGYADGVTVIEDPTDETTLVNTFWFPETERASRVVFACTGIASMAIFGGLIAAVDTSIRKKVLGTVGAIGIIWVLNIARNVFIAIANGYQWFDFPALVGPVMVAFGLSDPARVSFFVADRIIAQGLAVVALVGLGLLIARWIPELLAYLDVPKALRKEYRVSSRVEDREGGVSEADSG